MDSTGVRISVQEIEGVIEPTGTYRLLRLAGWFVATAGLIVGVGLASTLGFLERDAD